MVRKETESSPQSSLELPRDVRLPTFRGEWDEEGVYVYQAYNDELAHWAILHQRLGGPLWKPVRMTWIKPSFAWVLYRSGYGMKIGQSRILKIKLSHENLAILLSHCRLSHDRSFSWTKNKNGNRKKSEIGTNNSSKSEYMRCSGRARVQWDPERDLDCPEGHGKRMEPRRMRRTRAIQIGLSGDLSKFYVDSIISVEDVTELAYKVRAVHSLKTEIARIEAMESIRNELPCEREYLPLVNQSKLRELGMLPGNAATMINQIGIGNIKLK